MASFTRGHRKNNNNSQQPVRTAKTEKINIDLKLNNKLIGVLSIEHRMPSTRFEQAFANYMLKRMLTGGFIMILAACGLGFFVAGSLSRPVITALQRTKQISHGNYNLNSKINETGIIEMDDLTRGVEDLSRSLASQEKFRQRLMTDIAHELKTPLTASMTQLEAIADGVFPATPERLELCLNELDRLGNLIKSVESLTRLEGDALNIKLERINLSEFLDLTLNSFEPLFNKANIKLTRDITQNIFIDIDPEKFRHVIDNLLSNSLRYTQAGGSVTARGGNTKGNYSYGMDGAYLTVNDDAVLNASSGKGVYRYGNYGESYGIYSTQMTTMNGGAVTATGGESENYSAGIRGNLTVNDGQVIATGGYGKLRSCGAWGIEVTLSGGILTAAGGTSEQISAGVVSTALTVKDDAELTANGGTVQIKNAAGFIASIGIWGGDMTLENGNVTASGGTLKKDAEYDTFSNPTPSGTFGLYIPSGKTLSIKDGYLTATGGETLDELAPSVGNMAVYAASFTEAVGVVTRAGASMESAEEIMTPTSADLPQYYYLETEGAPYTILVVAGEEIQNKPKGTFYWKNNADNTGLTKEGASASDYSVSYDTQSKTLTLNGLDYEGDGFEDYGRFGVISYLEEPLKIALRGDNTISVSDAQEPVGGVVNSAETGGVYGMSFYSDVDFEGDGTLTVTAGRSYVGTSTGIEGYGNITFSDAVKINANASDTGTSSTTEQSIPLIGGSKRNSCAILCEEDGEVSIGEGAEVTATAGSSSGGSSFGVYAGSVTSAGKLTATAGSAFAGVFSSEFQDGSYGIYTGGDLNITDGTVSASGSTAAFAGMTAEGMIPGVTNGILCGGDVSLANGAALNATGGDGASESACQSCGLRAMNILSGGTLTAKGGNVTIGTSYGIQLSDRPESDETASGHTMTVTGGVLDADGGNANQSAAVFGVNPTCITVIGGEIYAKTGEVYPFEYQGETMHGIASAIVSSDEAVTVNIPVTYEVKGSTSSGTEQDTVISSLGETSADMSEKNKKEFTGMRDDVIDRGYVPCKRCCP